MADHQRVRPVRNGWLICAVLTTAVVALSGREAVALPAGQAPAEVKGVIPSADSTPKTTEPAAPDDKTRAPFAELNAALAAARARLEELSKAAAAAANAGQARQEITALKQENDRLHAEVAKLRQASHDSEARITELTKAAEDASAEAKRIDKDLVTMRWQNAQLNTSLTRAQAARDQALDEAHKTERTLSAKIDALTKSAEQSTTELARLRGALADAEKRLETATNGRSDAERQLTELQTKVHNAEAKSARLDEQLTTLRSQLAQAQSERDKAQARVAELAPEADRLRAALVSAAAQLTQTTRDKEGLEQEVARLRAAAGSAADVARQNLLAVEAGIKQLNAALDKPATRAAAPADGKPGMPKTIPAAAPAAGAEPAEAAAGAPSGPTPPAPTSAASAPPQAGQASPAAASTTTEAAAVDADLDRIKSAPAGAAPPDRDLMRLTAGLPLEKRLQVQGLLVDLGAKIGPWGLELTVPGRGLFATNSDQIQPTAEDTLAKVAELINAYHGHRVQIIGYTDSMGEAAYNKTLSQRRARLVKQFFVDNFAVDGRRLSTEGRGEDQPIASNKTPAGREANRRVEVMILN
jgi:outer membrane protein OmpA-like peptidoglycan-associated protein